MRDRTDKAKPGSAGTETARNGAFLRRWVFGGVSSAIVVSVAALVVVLILVGYFALSQHSDSRTSDGLKERIDKLEDHEAAEERRSRELERRLRRLEDAVANCSDCVPRSVFDETVSALREEQSVLNATLASATANLTLLREEVANLSSRVCGACDSLVARGPYDAFVSRTDAHFRTLENAVSEIQQRDFFLSTYYGTFQGRVAESEDSTSWSLFPSLDCSNRSVSEASAGLTTIEAISKRGKCPGTNRAIFVETELEPGKPSALVCPCENSLYQITIGITNLYVRRFNVGRAALRNDTGALTGGTQFRLGFVYAPKDDPERHKRFHEGPWPTPPVALASWPSSNARTNDTEGTYLGFSGTEIVHLARTVGNDTMACYRMLLVVSDNFARDGRASEILDEICSDHPESVLSIGYEFQNHPPSGSLPPLVTVRLQKYGWQGTAPPTP